MENPKTANVLFSILALAFIYLLFSNSGGIGFVIFVTFISVLLAIFVAIPTEIKDYKNMKEKYPPKEKSRLQQQSQYRIPTQQIDKEVLKKQLDDEALEKQVEDKKNEILIENELIEKEELEKLIKKYKLPKKSVVGNHSKRLFGDIPPLERKKYLNELDKNIQKRMMTQEQNEILKKKLKDEASDYDI